jgi:hypothetical protein
VTIAIKTKPLAKAVISETKYIHVFIHTGHVRLLARDR